MSRKKRKTLHGTVKKIIKFPYSNEKAEIDVHEADDLYREIRVDNEFTDDSGEKASLKAGAEVDVVIEADKDQIKNRDQIKDKDKDKDKDQIKHKDQIKKEPH